MTQWLVILDTGERIDFGPLGRSAIQETVRVEAETEDGARRRARAQKDGRVVEVRRFSTYHITLRGFADKRKRETFIVTATSEQEALRQLGWNPRAWRFAHFGSTKSRERALVKIERKD